MPLKHTFGELGDSRNNNFDFLRFFMAALVIYAHSFAFAIHSADPLDILTHWQIGFGSMAVQSFFAMSGYLVTRSWIHSKGWKDYARKRALRIIPGLTAALLFCVLVVGPLATTDLYNYFLNPYTYRYLGLMFAPDIVHYDRLPNVFAANIWQYEVNGSVWTIRYEVVCYILTAILGLLGWYRKPLRILLFSILIYGFDVAKNMSVLHLGKLGVIFHELDYFLIGMIAYLYRNHIPYSGKLFTLSLALLVISGKFGLLLWTMPILGVYVLFYIAFNQGLRLQHFARHGDFSYGVYLYAFPIQQLLVTYFPGVLSPNSLFFWALLLSIGCASLSWHYIEKPFLKMKSKD